MCQSWPLSTWTTSTRFQWDVKSDSAEHIAQQIGDKLQKSCLLHCVFVSDVRLHTSHFRSFGHWLSKLCVHANLVEALLDDTRSEVLVEVVWSRPLVNITSLTFLKKIEAILVTVSTLRSWSPQLVLASGRQDNWLDVRLFARMGPANNVAVGSTLHLTVLPSKNNSSGVDRVMSSFTFHLQWLLKIRPAVFLHF